MMYYSLVAMKLIKVIYGIVYTIYNAKGSTTSIKCRHCARLQSITLNFDPVYRIAYIEYT